MVAKHKPFGDVQHRTSPIIGFLRLERFDNDPTPKSYPGMIKRLNAAIANAQGTSFDLTYDWVNRKMEVDLSPVFDPAPFAEDVKFWLDRAIFLLQKNIDFDTFLTEDDYIEIIANIHTACYALQIDITRIQQENFFKLIKESERSYGKH